MFLRDPPELPDRLADQQVLPEVRRRVRVGDGDGDDAARDQRGDEERGVAERQGWRRGRGRHRWTSAGGTPARPGRRTGRHAAVIARAPPAPPRSDPRPPASSLTPLPARSYISRPTSCGSGGTG